jgi:hypothetical protein
LPHPLSGSDAVRGRGGIPALFSRRCRLVVVTDIPHLPPSPNTHVQFSQPQQHPLDLHVGTSHNRTAGPGNAATGLHAHNLRLLSCHSRKRPPPRCGYRDVRDVRRLVGIAAVKGDLHIIASLTLQKYFYLFYSWILSHRWGLRGLFARRDPGVLESWRWKAEIPGLGVLIQRPLL